MHFSATQRKFNSFCLQPKVGKESRSWARDPRGNERGNCNMYSYFVILTIWRQYLRDNWAAWKYCLEIWREDQVGHRYRSTIGWCVSPYSVAICDSLCTAIAARLCIPFALLLLTLVTKAIGKDLKYLPSGRFRGTWKGHGTLAECNLQHSSCRTIPMLCSACIISHIDSEQQLYNSRCQST